MNTELSPSIAAGLALGVYNVNNGDKRALTDFLDSKIFAESSSKIMQAEIGGRVFRAAKDAFGVCTLGGGKYQRDIFLIFRGTTEVHQHADVVTDARIGLTHSHSGLPVHIGFNHTFSSMLPELRQYLSCAKATGTIHCIGHSLGGAVASLVADWASRNTSNDVKLYSFGAPRVGTDWFVKSTTSEIGFQNIFRSYHRTDPVPMVALYPFMHAPYAKTGHYMNSSDPLTTGAAHKMDNYLASVKRKSWQQIGDVPVQAYNVEVFIEEWLKSKSPVDVNSSSFCQWVDSALIYVLKKVAMRTILSLQGSLMGAFTFADKMAYMLAKGIELAEDVGMWVVHLMRKLMQALGMKIAETQKELTQKLMQNVLLRITEKANREARSALKKL